MQRLILTAATVSLASLLYAQAAHARPSWCKKPKNATEKTICANGNLSSLDDVLNVAYRRALSDSPGQKSKIRSAQRHWLGLRNSCGTHVGCIEGLYEEQIGILEGYYSN